MSQVDAVPPAVSAPAAAPRLSDPEEFAPGATTQRLADGIVAAVRQLQRRGAVVAVSGGVDSSVVAALCARALGPERVLLLRLPEHGISDRSTELAAGLATSLRCPSVEQSITPAFEALGCAEQQRAAVRLVFPGLPGDLPFKLVRSAPGGGLTVFSLVVRTPDGREHARRMPPDAYRMLLSATNAKQRLRTLISYTWADRCHYAVAGTPNLLEYDQGFFVKGGDGLADLKPIAGLYKGQVHALARHLGLPEEIAGRPGTTETFALPQSQEEFYFGHPPGAMDLLLWGEANAVPAAVVAARAGMGAQAVEDGYREVARRRGATAYLHAPALLLDGSP